MFSLLILLLIFVSTILGSIIPSHFFDKQEETCSDFIFRRCKSESDLEKIIAKVCHQPNLTKHVERCSRIELTAQCSELPGCSECHIIDCMCVEQGCSDVKIQTMPSELPERIAKICPETTTFENVKSCTLQEISDKCQIGCSDCDVKVCVCPEVS